MKLILLLALCTLPARAKSLACQVSTPHGPYAGGVLTVEENEVLSVRWRGSDGREEVLMGGTKICAEDARGLSHAPVCTSSFTRPTPLKKMVTLCRLPNEAGAKWIGSLSLSLDPRDGSGTLRCTTGLAPYADFDLRLAGCQD